MLLEMAVVLEVTFLAEVAVLEEVSENGFWKWLIMFFGSRN